MGKLAQESRGASSRYSSKPRGSLQLLISFAASNGYESIGWTGGGRIAAGAPADLISVAVESNRLAGADPALPGEAVVFAAAADDVADVIVAGRHVVSDGVHVEVSVPSELERAITGLFS